MTLCATSLLQYFTQTDPTPYGAGTAFEGAYDYAGDRPAVLIDLSGNRGIDPTLSNPVGDANPESLVAASAPVGPCGDPKLPPAKRLPSPACVIGVQMATTLVPLGFDKWLSKRSNGQGKVLVIKNEQGQQRAIQSDGGCSAPTGDTGRSFNFRNPCRTHDLGYDLIRFFDSSGSSGQIRRAVDSLFYLDLKIHCSSRPNYLVSACIAWARTYYQAVAANSSRQGHGVP